MSSEESHLQDNMTRVQLADQHSTRVSARHRGNRNGLRARGWMGMAGYMAPEPTNTSPPV